MKNISQLPDFSVKPTYQKYHGFVIWGKTEADPFYNLTSDERKLLKEEIKIIKATRKANGWLGGNYTNLDIVPKIEKRHISTNKIMRDTIKEVKKAYKAENVPDTQLDIDYSEFDIKEPTAVNDTLQWIRDFLNPKDKDNTPAGMGIAHSPSATLNDDNKPKENKPQTAKWNAVGVAFALVGAGLVTWGIVSYIKTKKKKKAAANQTE